MKKINYTTRRKSKSIHICPVCGKKGLLSIEKTEGKKKVYIWKDHYLHKGYITDGGSKIFTVLCIVDHVAGTSISICKEPQT